MSRQRISIFLILMMAISPVASALDQCAGMALSAHHNAINNIEASPHTIDSGHQQTDSVNCHVSGSCYFHACGCDGMVASILSINTRVSSSYSVFEYSSFDNTVPSPTLRPPIFVL